jgi:hypothetical protein
MARTVIKEGMLLRIVSMRGEPGYSGRTGRVEFIDSVGQIHGTWGGCALQPEQDVFEVVGEDK